MSDNKTDNLKTNQFANRVSQIQTLYAGEDGLGSLFDRNRFKNQSFTRELYQNIKRAISGGGKNLPQIIGFSEEAYALNRNYAGVLDYLSNMFLWRYYYVPVNKRNVDLQLDEIYDIMTEVMDGMNIRITYPNLLLKMLIEGVVYVYTVKNNSSKTVSTLTLPAAFCSPTVISQYGTGVYTFNLSYFDSLNLPPEKLADMLLLFPDEITNAYFNYKQKKGEKKIQLDPRFATYFQMNDSSLPGFLGVLDGVLNYEDYKLNELERNSAELDNIFIHRIPIYEDRPIFDVPESQALHRRMSSILSGNKRLRLLTTFGNTELIPIQSKSNVQNETLEKAFKAIYFDSGLNVGLFNSETQLGIETSLKRDASIMWKYIEQITNFYNLTINNLFSFKGYQIEFSILPITHYNQEKMMELYRRNSEFGVGKLELIVASGTRQEHIRAKAEVENFLKLDDILIPLKSSHTRSGTEEEEKETVSPQPEKEPEPEDVEEK